MFPGHFWFSWSLPICSETWNSNVRPPSWCACFPLLWQTQTLILADNLQSTFLQLKGTSGSPFKHLISRSFSLCLIQFSHFSYLCLQPWVHSRYFVQYMKETSSTCTYLLYSWSLFLFERQSDRERDLPPSGPLPKQPQLPWLGHGQSQEPGILSGSPQTLGPSSQAHRQGDGWEVKQPGLKLMLWYCMPTS